MKRIAVPGMLLMLAACTAPSPYTRVHDGLREPPTPAPTAEHPDAYNYLPSVIGGECSEAEYPLFASLRARPLAEARPLLETLGIIRDHKLVPAAGGMTDEGWMQAINSRQRLIWKKDFATPEGSRVAWLFIRGFGAGNQGQRVPATAVLSSGDGQVITFKPTLIWMAFELRPAALAYPDSTVLQVVNRYDRIVGGSVPRHEFPPVVIRFSTTGIDITPGERVEGPSE